MITEKTEYPLKGYTVGDYFSFGYLPFDMFKYRTSKDQLWFTSYYIDDSVDKNMKFKDACIYTAVKIKEAANAVKKHIVLLISGGIDSEFMLRVFYDAKIYFTVAIIGFYVDGRLVNLHDISFAISLCEHLGCAYKLIDVHIDKFFEEVVLPKNWYDNNIVEKPQGYKYMEKYGSYVPARAAVFAGILQIDLCKYFPVIGQGEPLLVNQQHEMAVCANRKLSISSVKYLHFNLPNIPNNVLWNLWDEEDVMSWYRLFSINNIDGVPGFFQYTPEIFISYLKHDVTTNLVKTDYKYSNLTSKHELYNSCYNIVSRKGYNGFEKVFPRFDTDVRTRAKLSHPLQIYKIPYHGLMEILGN